MFTVGIITASDEGYKGNRIDESGQVIRCLVEEQGYKVKVYKVLPDEEDVLMEEMLHYCDELQVDLLLTTGGTGFSQRDVTPEATKNVIEREAMGISEAIRYYGLKKTSRAMLSRGISGIRGKTLIINLPGSPKAVRESLEAILDSVHHGLEILSGHTKECGRRITR
jgi:molybdenum cofactor synthesis domain-containing protein